MPFKMSILVHVNTIENIYAIRGSLLVNSEVINKLSIRFRTAVEKNGFRFASVAKEEISVR